MTDKIISYEETDNYVILKIKAYSFGHGEVNKIKEGSIRKIENLDYPNIIMDLNKVHFIDSSVIGFMMNFKKMLEKKEKKFALVCQNPNILEIITMINLQKIIKIFENQELAIKFINEQ